MELRLDVRGPHVQGDLAGDQVAEGEGGREAVAVLGEGHVHGGALVLHAAGDLEGLVGGDGAADAQHDALAAEGRGGGDLRGGGGRVVGHRAS